MEETLKQTKPLKLNLGCGNDVREGYINIDKYNIKADVKADIMKLPYENDSVNEILISHVIEHISWRLHIVLFEEMHRVLSKEGKLIFAYPEFEKFNRIVISPDFSIFLTNSTCYSRSSPLGLNSSL